LSPAGRTTTSRLVAILALLLALAATQPAVAGKVAAPAGHDHGPAVPAGRDPRNDPDSGIELIGRPAPAWHFDRWVRGGPLKLADLRGKVVLVRFWTEKCRFCEMTLPALELLRTRHANDGLVVIGAFHPNEPKQKRTDARILEVADSLGFGGPIACDEAWRTLNRYWLDGHPDRNWVSTSFLIDREGVIRWVHGGGEYHAGGDPRHARCEVKLRELEQVLERTLAEGRAVDAPVGSGAAR
jgi:thiol-disulfide isomerase/thioredoxin